MSDFRVGIVGAASSFTFIFADSLVEAEGVTYAGLAYMGRDPKYIKDSLSLPWLVDRPKTIEAYQETYGVPVYETLDELIEKGNLDGLCIATEDYLHKTYALKAMEAGIHVFVPKPFAKTHQEAAEMFAAAKQRGLVLRGSLPNRFEPHYLKTNELIEAGAIGRPLMGHFHQEHHLSLGGWKSDPTMASGPAFEMGFYTMDAMAWLMKSEPRTISAFCANLDHQGIPYIDNATCIVQYQNDAMASADMCFSLHHRFLGHAGLHIIGDEGALVWEHGPTPFGHVIAVHSKDGVERLDAAPRTNYKGGEVLHWIEMCQRGEDPSYWTEQSMHTLDFILAMQQAYETNQPVDWATFDPTRA